MCRNNLKTYRDTSKEVGSPLRVQEQLKKVEGNMGLSRITPACAGTTTELIKEIENDKDHPCMCRNNVTLVLAFPKDKGITPACAGTTLNDPLFFNDPFLEILEIYSL